MADGLRGGTRLRRWLAGAILVMVTALVAVAWIMPLPFSSQDLRRSIIDELSARLESQVELGSVRFRLFPRLTVVAEGLVIRHKRNPDVPLISVKTVEASSGLRSLLRWHVETVVLRGLEITISPGSHATDPGGQPARVRTGSSVERQVLIDDLTADEATLTVLRRDTRKPARVWRMHRLRLQSVGVDQAMPFQSALSNAVPPGDIDTNGTFGPWNADDPGLTPVSGSFVFERADLGHFKGLAGTLSSRGAYQGTLERLQVEGRTSTPDFMLSVGSRPVRLDTEYQAIVDATNGNTTLSRVNASFGKTSLVASGGVYEVEGVRGRLTSLTIRMQSGRLEDVLGLAMDTPRPTMTGALVLTAALELPPGPRSVVDKLSLNGDFDVDGGRFTDEEVQGKINELSGRARGKHEETAARVSSGFAGHFALKDARLSLTPVRFDVPGALVEVSGVYALHTETLAFGGKVVMDAPVSQAVGGWKAWLLKPFDPLFRREGRTFVPITIDGPRAKPNFGIDKKRIFNKDDAPTAPSMPRERRDHPAFFAAAGPNVAR